MNEINLYSLGLDLKFCDLLYFRNKCFYTLEINAFGHLDLPKNKTCPANCRKTFYIRLNLIKESMIVII